MASQILEKKTWNYAMKLKNLKLDPAAVIGVEYYNIKRVDRSTKSRIHFVKRLRVALSRIGKINTVKNGNLIGGCAEAGAANKVLFVSKGIQIYDLQFSIARRPKTMQPVPTCLNCRQTFYGI
jgi:hypothetical protein